MAFSLSSWFKGKPGENDPEPPEAAQAKPAPSVPPPAPATPPPSVRTVMPSGQGAQNPVSLRTPGAPPLPKPPTTVTRNLPVRPPARKVSFPVPPTAGQPAPVVAPAPVPAPAPAAMKAPAPAPAAPTAPDVAVNLQVGDFIDRIPPGYLQEGSFERERVVEFRASELYSDLSKGRASVPASTIYAKCPEIFARPVTDTEDFEVQLPLQKLVEQLSAAFTTRPDQVAEENVGEIETPFLKVAMEDNARLPAAQGTAAGALRPAVNLPAPPTKETVNTGIPQRPAHRTGSISTISAKPVAEPPPAPVLNPPTAPINPGKRPPSTVRASVAGGKIRLSGPAAVTRMTPVAGPAVPPPAESKAPGGSSPAIPMPAIPAMPPSSAVSPSHQVTKKTARIQIPPISLKAAGTGNTPRPPGAIPPPPSVPVQPSPVSIRPTAGAEPPVTFRSSPPPPTSKLPPSFAPARPSFPPPSFPAVPPSAPAPAPAVPAAPAPFAAPDDRKISLSLAAVLRGQPASALAVEPSDVPDDIRITLPFSPIERQLSAGRVSVPRHAFVNALPDSHKHVLAEDSDLPEVQIPLQEIFQNLPGNVLTIRQDQVTEEVGIAYPTPFSQKAEEDAQRLGAVAPVSALAFTEPALAPEPPAVDNASAAVAPEEATSTGPSAAIFEEASPSVPPVPEVVEEVPRHDLPLPPDEPAVAEVTGIHPAVAEEPPAAVEPAPVAEALAVLESTAPGEETVAEQPAAVPPTPAPSAAPAPVAPVAEPVQHPAAVGAQDSVLQTLLMTEDELDAKSVVRHVCLLPGITGCAVMFADGLRLAGNFPDGDAEGFSAMAPPFFKRTGHFTTEAELGALQAITLYTDRGLVSFFMHGDICVSVRHAGRGFLPGVREKLEIVTRELARMYGTKSSE